jgi:Zn-dependent protease
MQNQSLKEFSNILAAIIILTILIAFFPILEGNLFFLATAFSFSVIIISVYIFSRKIFAYSLDSGVEHELWFSQRFGFKTNRKFKKPIPLGIIAPLFFSIFSLGILKVPTLLTYETRALKSRTSKRFGHYSFKEMTEFHNALIGASGIISLLLLAIISYFLPLPETEILAKTAIYFAFFNLLPLSKLDGTQIFFGSRILYALLASITSILTAGALLIS